MALINTLRRQLSFVLSVTMIIPTFTANAQFPSGWKDFKNGRRSGVPSHGDFVRKAQEVTNVIMTINQLIAFAHMNQDEYKRNVKVEKGVVGEKYDYTTPKKDKINKPKRKNDKDEFANLVWQPVTYFDKHLFPSEIISMYDYSGPRTGLKEAIINPLGFRIYSKYGNMPINWEIECVGKKFFEKTSGYYIYDQKGQIVDLLPPIKWDFDILKTQDVTTPVTVVFRLFDADDHKIEEVKHLTVRSINDCIYRYKDLQLNFMFAAFVQEKHPEIDKIRKQATNTKIISSIPGYQNGEEYVHKQVEAVWTVLHNRGFKYGSASTPSAVADTTISCQAVRTFANAIKTNEGNCVDGTVMFASILRNMGIHPLLLITSNHCFLGYYTDAEKTKMAYLETTMLAGPPIVKSKGKPVKKPSIHSQFLLAQKKGEEKYLEQMELDDIIVIDVDKYRKNVKSIPFN